MSIGSIGPISEGARAIAASAALHTAPVFNEGVKRVGSVVANRGFQDSVRGIGQVAIA